MIKAIIFDSDGMITYDPIFSKTYAAKYGVPLDEILPFFVGPFKDCLVGKADLKEELQKGWLQKWGWTGSTEEFLDYWFSVGSTPDDRLIETISRLRGAGILCTLATNQEKYRADHMVSAFSYEKIFNDIFISASVGHKKPKAEFFDVAFNHLKNLDPSIQKNEILFWDDDIENVEGAHHCGFSAEQYKDFDDYIIKMNIYGLLK